LDFVFYGLFYNSDWSVHRKLARFSAKTFGTKSLHIFRHCNSCNHRFRRYPSRDGLAVGATGHRLTLVAKLIIRNRQKEFRRKYVEGRELTQLDLEVMDSDGDGKVSMADFFEFMLIAMENVDPTVMKRPEELFPKTRCRWHWCLG
jgi:hypothetical protein